MIWKMSERPVKQVRLNRCICSVPRKLEFHVFHFVVVHSIKSLLLSLVEQILPVACDSWSIKQDKITVTLTVKWYSSEMIFITLLLVRLQLLKHGRAGTCRGGGVGCSSTCPFAPWCPKCPFVKTKFPLLFFVFKGTFVDACPI